MFRKITSLTSFFSIIVLTFTSIVLYIVPQGRVAYWADWSFLGLTKEQWGDIHICTGILFIVVSILHIWLNWKPILAYLKQRSSKSNFSSPAFFISILITLFVVTGTLAGIPPMKQILDFATHLKDEGQRKYGLPPYGHAELSPLSIFCQRTGLDLDKAVNSLKQAGLHIESTNESIKSIAANAGITPKDLYEVIVKDQPRIGKSSKSKPQRKVKQSQSIRSGSGAGIGRMSLETFCQKNRLDLNTALGILREKGAVVDKSTTIREIAATLGFNSPHEVRMLLKP